MEDLVATPEVKGIKDTLEVITAGLAIGAALNAAVKDDGKITFSDLPKFMPLTGLVVPAVEDVANIPAELADLSEAELVQIQDVVVAAVPSLGVSGKWIEAAQEALAIGLHSYKLFNVLKA